MFLPTSHRPSVMPPNIMQMQIKMFASILRVDPLVPLRGLKQTFPSLTYPILAPRAYSRRDGIDHIGNRPLWVVMLLQPTLNPKNDNSPTVLNLPRGCTPWGAVLPGSAETRRGAGEDNRTSISSSSIARDVSNDTTKHYYYYIGPVRA